MTRRDNRDGIAAVGRTDGAARAGPPDLRRKLPIAARLAERNRGQRFPYLALKRGAHKVEAQRKAFELTREVRLKLPLRFEQLGMLARLLKRSQRDAPRIVAFPKHRGQPT